MEVRIRICEDNVYCAIEEGAGLIKPALTYTAIAHSRRGGRYKERKYPVVCMSEDNFFLQGFLERIYRYLDEKGIPVKLIAETPVSLVDILEGEPHLPDIVFRPAQRDLVIKAGERRRGYIKGPTGFGKTVIAGGIISIMPDAKILFLCHTIDLLEQTAKEFRNWFGKDQVGIVNKDRREFHRRIIVATRQTFRSCSMEEHLLFDAVIVDECHHMSGEKSEYNTILQKMVAEVRIGLTATPPNAYTDPEGTHSIEGNLGPMIGEYTIQEGIEQGYLARPIMHFLVSKDMDIPDDIRKYSEVYDIGVTNNRSDNWMIMMLARDLADRGLSSLILIDKLAHGEALVHIAQLLKFKDAIFIHGSTESGIREEVKRTLNEKERKCVIASVIWREGVNIPSLDAIINAAQGKSERATLQALGRGLRTTETKSEVHLYDIMNGNHRFFVNHFFQRMKVYVREGWV